VDGVHHRKAAAARPVRRGFAITFLTQTQGGLHSDSMSFLPRLTTAALAYGTSIRQLFWPANLAPIYPQLQGAIVAWQIALAAAVLIVITALVFIFWKTRPHLATGWLWFLGMLLPVMDSCRSVRRLPPTATRICRTSAC
jgi:hypothetical protein